MPSAALRPQPYLAACIRECAADLALDAEISRVFLPGGAPLAAGDRVVNAAYADTLRSVAREGAAALYGGAIGRAFTDDMQRHGAWLAPQDLLAYATNDMAALHARYQGFDLYGPPPPCAGPLAHRPDAADPAGL